MDKGGKSSWISEAVTWKGRVYDLPMIALCYLILSIDRKTRWCNLIIDRWWWCNWRNATRSVYLLWPLSFLIHEFRENWRHNTAKLSWAIIEGCCCCCCCYRFACAVDFLWWKMSIDRWREKISLITATIVHFHQLLARVNLYWLCPDNNNTV